PERSCRAPSIDWHVRRLCGQSPLQQKSCGLLPKQSKSPVYYPGTTSTNSHPPEASVGTLLRFLPSFQEEELSNNGLQSVQPQLQLKETKGATCPILVYSYSVQVFMR